MTASYELFVRDAALDRVAQIDDFTSALFVLRFNRPGSWQVKGIPADGVAGGYLEAGAGLIVRRNDGTLLSGPMDWRNRKWSDQSGSEENHLNPEGPDDLIHLWDRVVHPSPADLLFASDDYDVRTGVASTIMREFVDQNAGPTAPSARRVAGLTLAADPVLGSSVTGRGRMQQLGDLLAELALAGGDLGFTVVQSGSGIEFQVYDPEDLTAEAVFSPEMGNLISYTYDQRAPSANYAYVGGGGEGTARTFVEGGDNPSISTWGRRIERFVDQRQTTVVAELNQKRDEELTSAAERLAVTLDPLDTDAIAFGTDYNLGDTVTAVLDEVAIELVVREVRIELSAAGDERVTPVLATPGATPGTSNPALALYDRVRGMGGRLTTIERV